MPGSFVKLLSNFCMVGPMSEGALLRIGELSRRSGVTPELLRAWERRYGLLRPTRSEGGLRLYSPDDLERVRSMQRHLAAGLAAAEAAALAAEPAAHADETVFSAESARAELERALDVFDESRANVTLDEILSAASLDKVLSDVVLPFLHRLGERWRSGEVSVAQEHFASAFLRARLFALARGWDRGLGPRVLLACAPGERHELGLVAFGLALRARGFRVFYLGADTPIESVASAAGAVAPDAVVVSAVRAERLRGSADELRELARTNRVYLGGAGAATAAIDAADVLPADVVAAADMLAERASR